MLQRTKWRSPLFAPPRSGALIKRWLKPVHLETHAIDLGHLATGKTAALTAVFICSKLP